MKAEAVKDTVDYAQVYFANMSGKANELDNSSGQNKASNLNGAGLEQRAKKFAENTYPEAHFLGANKFRKAGNLGKNQRIKLNRNNKKFVDMAMQFLQKKDGYPKGEKRNVSKSMTNSIYNFRLFLKYLEERNIKFSSLIDGGNDIYSIKKCYISRPGNRVYVPSFLNEFIDQLKNNYHNNKAYEKNDDVTNEFLESSFGLLANDERRFVENFLATQNSALSTPTENRSLSNPKIRSVLDFVHHARSLTGDQAVIFAEDFTKAAAYLDSQQLLKLPKSFLRFCESHKDEMVSIEKISKHR